MASSVKTPRQCEPEGIELKPQNDNSTDGPKPARAHEWQRRFLMPGDQPVSFLSLLE